jgi:hypothetical protein
MNEPKVPHTTINPQAHPRYDPPKQDPLKEALTAMASLKLHPKRFRRDLVGSRQLAATNRLLAASDAFGRSIEWLRGGSVGIEDGPEELAQLAMDSRAVPGAAEAVAQ